MPAMQRVHCGDYELSVVCERRPPTIYIQCLTSVSCTISMDCAKLIAIVQQYEEIYNLNHPSYSNFHQRDNIWKEIGKQMNETGRVCKGRWFRIRDNHRKALNLRKRKSEDAAASKIKPPKFYKELEFLAPYLQDEELRQSNVSPAITTKVEGEAIDGSSRTSTVPTPTPSPSIASSSSRRCLRRGEKRVSAASVLHEYSSNREMVEAFKLPSDTLTEFFINMAHTVLQFPVRDQIEIKGKLFNMVNAVESRLANVDNEIRRCIITPTE
ncbi:hypothetical protein FQA39_LY12719 [Lamprigera yunnana]|nr:hypothetical protein FQA39_LY12719 [Lamprigera yunnana]